MGWVPHVLWHRESSGSGVPPTSTVCGAGLEGGACVVVATAEAAYNRRFCVTADADAQWMLLP
jgi:hypothetical protein